MSSTVPVPLSYTVSDAATDLVRLEQELPGSVLGSDWRTAGQVARALRGRNRSRELDDFGTVASALEFLALRGIATSELEEWEVRASRPQRYRRARTATPEALERFANPSVPCAGPGCDSRVSGKSRHCSKRCRDNSARLGHVTRRRR